MLKLVCERSGEHKVPKKSLKHEATGSRKCGCLFKLRGYVVKEENTWKLAIFNCVHNHEMLPYLVGNLLTGRLMENDKEIVRDLTKSSVKSKNILTNLKGKRKEFMENIKQVYNERHKFKKAKRGNLTEMQFLISKLEENKYVYFIREKCDSDTIQDIFWTHPQSVKFFNNFPTVLIIDSTYKTNVNMMSLFEIVGFTSTDMTYSVGPALTMATTNRVEGAHGIVKEYLTTSKGDLGVESYSGTSPKSPIPNETTNQRGFAVVSVSGDHNDVTTSKKGTNQRSQEKKFKSKPKVASTSQIPSSWETIDSQFPDSQSSPKKVFTTKTIQFCVILLKKQMKNRSSFRT
ncbi:hypothetical protein MTR_4g057300 [Medicago truncatula]|uniref:ZSWIM1/3 RNaseH-like domain-containing protein n=1 Tax=Medicago truncatula TaxID=3880 RepID=G7JNA0_MEDTR|nr:hypothetical protein MTR_4g057300 [Medicago truncatula]